MLVTTTATSAGARGIGARHHATHLGPPLLLVRVLEGAHPVLVAPRLGRDALVLERPQRAIVAKVRRRVLLQILERKTHDGTYRTYMPRGKRDRRRGKERHAW